MLRRLAELIYDHPGLTATVLLMVLCLAAFGASRLQLDFSSTSFYRGDDDLVRQLEDFEAQWGPDDDVLVIVVEATEGHVLTRERMAVIEELTDELGRVDEVGAVESISTQRIPAPVAHATLPFADVVLAAADPVAEVPLQELPWVPILLSADARYAAIAVELEFSSEDLAAVVPVVDAIGQVVARHDGREGLTLGLAGVPAIRAGFFRLTLRDQVIFVPAALVLIGTCLFVVFRRIHGVVIPALAATIPLLLLVGAMGFTGEPVGLINQAYFTLVPVLAVADSIHLLSRYHEEVRHHAPRRAVVRAVEHVGLACTLTTATTALAFLSLGIGGMPILRSFGVYAGLGMVFAYGTVLVSLPLFVRIAPGTSPPASDAAFVAAIGRLAARRRVVVVVVGLLVGAAGLAAGSRVVVDNRLSALLQPSHPVRQASAELDESLGGSLSLELDVVGEPGIFTEPAVVKEVAALERWALEQSGVRAVVGPGRFTLGYAALNGRDLSSRMQVKDSYLGLRSIRSLTDIVSDDFGRARISIRVAEPGGRAFEAFADRVTERATETLAPHGLEVRVTGTTLLAYRGVNQIAGDLLESLLLVFGVVTLLMLALFRSPRIAALSLLPNGLPLAIGYGTIGVLGWDLDPLAAVILALGVGIAVDDTIHVLVRARERLRDGDSLEKAIEDTLRHSGRAVAVTSVVISGGLLINVMSSFPPLVMLGVLGTVVMLSALICDLALLPALLLLFRADAGMHGRD